MIISILHTSFTLLITVGKYYKQGSVGFNVKHSATHNDKIDKNNQFKENFIHEQQIA